MEEAPPVPPKDPEYSARMELDRPLTAPSSGSKRKRSTQDETYHLEHSELENVDPDGHTPKRNRNRSTVPYDDASASEDATAGKHRSIRKKKGSMNLSTLNLRHAAAKQAQIRESKFQEGSLSDKPSERPPSVFLRVPRSESDHSLKVDEMMEDYHDDVSVPRYSTTTKQQRPHSRAMVHMETYKKEDGKGLFQFGRQIAASFNPATLWQRWWSEPKEEATHAAGEAEEKARQKAEVEARYAEMKKNGQFGFQTVRRRPSTAASGSEDLQTPRDSGIEIESLQNTRGTLGASSLMPPADDTTSHSGSEIPDTATKQSKTLKSRLHFKKPSLSNINDSLKRVKSDLNLGAAVARQRESSSSVSPIKQDFENSALKRSQSRYDLKKTNKLSKRVSDLESKLEQAKRELDEALVDASPVPNLTSKYPTFKPAATFRRPKFVPGKLPSLPSERILMAEQMKGIRGDHESEGEPRKALDLNEPGDDFQMNEADETIKASRERSYPTRASTLFNLDNDNNNLEETTSDNTVAKAKELLQEAELLTGTSKNMDPNSLTNGAADNAPKQVETEGYSSLDAKLKALEENVKIANKAKQTKPKKRKSNADDDKLFKPGKESDGDSDWEEFATPKKKRKSGGGKNETSPKNQRSSKGTKQSPPKAKKGKSDTAKANSLSVAARAAAAVQQTMAQDQVMHDAEASVQDDEFSPDEGAASEDEAARTSTDSQDRTLGVVYEEEEDMVTGAVRKPVAATTAATFGRSSLRSRSNSPHKRAASVQPGVEEQLITRAAIAAKQHPGRMKSRSISPPPANGYTKTMTVEETVSVKPGANGVPKLPKGANGSFESLEELGVQPDEVEVLGRKGKKASFEWPDDVF